ncbi:hypothetical protein I4F81_003158 [Pyropia yezoensis]|uniref:Uncharacterized protein n=1 Tax=Pyropia yezoensis TaxID=2788 RepID=A0ACC3BS59_PYRYE|nr:hypothetical protein I4F81_003158 [Neopyropia yezoensis]
MVKPGREDSTESPMPCLGTDVESLQSYDAPPAALVVEQADDAVEDADDAADSIGPPDPVIQDSVSCSEVQLPVGQFADCAKDLALFTYAFNYGLTEAALADFLNLRACQATY